MDAAPPVAQELSVSWWSGDASPHKLAEVLSLVLPLLPLDARARAARVCRAWRTAAAHPELWKELDFAGCATNPLFDGKTLAKLCARAGAALRTLRLDPLPCRRVRTEELLAALRKGGCTGLRSLSALQHRVELTPKLAKKLVAACPLLQHTEVTVHCTMSEVATVLTALPGPLALSCRGNVNEGLTHLVESLRVSSSLASLDIGFTSVDVTGATQLAECLRVNATLKVLDLSDNDIGAAGATSLAQCLRINATLTSLDLRYNHIGDEGATQLAECMCSNSTLNDKLEAG